MRTKSMLLASFLFIGGVVSSAFAESYTDGIEYFKSGQPDRAKIILDKTLKMTRLLERPRHIFI